MEPTSSLRLGVVERLSNSCVHFLSEKIQLRIDQNRNSIEI